ncbi:septum formation family protein [Actinomadura yumaensis]|uniref:DUF4190 domain-containing protein n=1 Tax=Actinomadura yumaensis TaxID=111807 RepID=UPI0036175AA8
MTVPPNADNAPEDPAPGPSSWTAPDPGPEAAPAPRPMAVPMPYAQGPQPPEAYAGRPAPVPPRTNRFAVVALVTGLIGWAVLGIGFGIAALVRIRRRGERGTALAVSGIVLSTAWLVVFAVAGVLVAVGSSLTVDRDEAGRVTRSGRALVASLKVGDCFDGFGENKTGVLVTVRPCGEPHHGEVMARVRLADGPYPGDGAVRANARDACEARVAKAAAKSRYVDELSLYAGSPNARLWKDGDREVTCVLRYSGDEPLTSRVADTADPGVRAWAEVRAGDCVKDWNTDAGSVVRTSSCDEPHKHQVIGVHDLKPGRWPGSRAVDAETSRGASGGARRRSARARRRCPSRC